MAAVLNEYSRSGLCNLLVIGNDQVSSVRRQEDGSYVGEDIIVGRNQTLVIIIPSGAEVRVRDIVNLGRLVLQGADLDPRPVMRARNIFFIGDSKIKRLDVFAKNRVERFSGGVDGFYQELREQIVERFDSQGALARVLSLRDY